MLFRDVKNQLLLLYCSRILKGLPSWATEIQEKTMNYSDYTDNISTNKEYGQRIKWVDNPLTYESYQYIN